MRFFFSYTLLASTAFHLGVFAAPANTPSKVPITKFAGAKNAGSYIITLKEGAARTPIAQKLGPSTTIYDKSVLNGFAAKVTPEQLEELRLNPDVASIEEDGITYAQGEVTQTNAPWGLGRISQDGPLTSTDTGALNYPYRYETNGNARFIDVYVIDTGINTAHVEFGGRAVWGATFGGYPNADGSGHGTHMAGIIGGTTYGVAKNVRLIAVKVLSDSGSGSISDVISGFNWVRSAAQSSGRYSIINTSISGPASAALDSAVTAVINSGIAVVVASGGSNGDASQYSPGRVPGAITVAASDIRDRFSSSSNWGPAVDIIAPGVGIISAYAGSNTATATLSGSSTAAAFASGLIAYCTSIAGLPVSEGVRLFFNFAVPNRLTGVPAGTVNLLVNNEF